MLMTLQNYRNSNLFMSHLLKVKGQCILAIVCLICAQMQF
jgi:hypothetical protein